MRYFILFILMNSTSLFAGEWVQRQFDLDFHGDNEGNRIFYLCDSAKKLLENRLRALGAQSLLTNCSGGLESYGRIPHWQPLALHAVFEAPTSNDKKVVVLNSKEDIHEDCFFNVALIEKAVALFPKAKILKKKGSCLSNYTKWSYSVEVSE